ncbi:MAG: hypothetical protein KF851_01410 [Pirellulaceae bacterium]|nr:hypothetical protein [Pirellulaceae bacterium]
MTHKDWRISSFLHEHVKHFEEHSKRVATVVDEARERFNKDYTGYCAGFSAVVIAVSLVAALFRLPEGVAIAGVIVGGIALIGSLACRHLNQRQQVSFMKEVIELERERSKAAQRAATLHEIWLYGIPDGTSLAQIQVLLGDQPTAVTADGKPMTWKALPAPPDTEDDEADKDDVGKS